MFCQDHSTRIDDHESGSALNEEMVEMEIDSFYYNQYNGDDDLPASWFTRPYIPWSPMDTSWGNIIMITIHHKFFLAY